MADRGDMLKKVVKNIKFKTPSKMDDPKYIDKKIKEEQKKEDKKVKVEEKPDKESSKDKSRGEAITEKIKEIKFKSPSKMDDPKYLEKKIKHIQEKVKEKIKKKDK